MPIGDGANLGTASGRITIDTSNLRGVEQTSQRVGQNVERNLNRIGTGAARADASLRDLAGAFGLVGGVAGAIQFGRFAISADAAATAYRRQSVAAVSLAGSQQNLNRLLESYDRVTGGAVDRATALSDVTTLMAVGFADTTDELERFVSVSRGASLAVGRSVEQVTQILQFELANQTGQRLNELGLAFAEVQDEVERLRSSNRGLTQEAAYQRAVLALLERKYGDLAKSTEAQATGAEDAAKAWRDARLAFGELTAAPSNYIGSGIANWINQAIDHSRLLRTEWERLQFTLSFGRFGSLNRPGAGVNVNRSFRLQEMQFGGRTSRGAGGLTEDQTALVRQRFDDLRRIEQDANEARIDATRQYEEQRTSTIRQYERTIAREAEDFGRQRARAEEEFARSIADVRESTARREAEQVEDLQDKIADLRSNTDERLLDLEENYARNRERAARQHRDNLLSAASRLDARAVAEEQRRFRRQQLDAEESFRDSRNDIRAQLDERIQQEQEAHRERLQDAREADERRIADMQEDFDRRQRLEDEDRLIRLQRMAADHQDQLSEMDRQHQLDLQQIARNAREERQETQRQFQIALNELGIATDAWIAENKRLTDAAIKDFTRWRNAVTGAFEQQSRGGPGWNLRPMLRYQEGGPVRQTGPAFLHQGEFVLSRQMLNQGMGAGVTIQPGAFVFNGMSGTPAELEGAMERVLERVFRSLQ